MKFENFKFRPEVERDIKEAMAWYEKNLGKGMGFWEEFLYALHRISDGPKHYAVQPNGFRPCRLRRFSYIVHYTIQDDHVLIVGVLAGARHDSVLKNRR